MDAANLVSYIVLEYASSSFAVVLCLRPHLNCFSGKGSPRDKAWDTIEYQVMHSLRDVAQCSRRYFVYIP
jgi:hypothetical protein